MAPFQPVIITAVVSVAVIAWAILCAFIIGLACEHMKRDDAELIEVDATLTESTPSSAACPMHGPNCEAWL